MREPDGLGVNLQQGDVPVVYASVGLFGLGKKGVISLVLSSPSHSTTSRRVSPPA